MFLQPDFEGNPDPFPFPFIPPTADPGGGDTIRIEVNREWLQFVTGAATMLCLARMWITEDEAAAQEIHAKAQDLLGVLNTPVVEKPFYESDEDASDEDLPDAPWYEDVADWIIEAFLAITFTPGAAIVYKTTIPRLRLAFRTGDLGAIARVFINDLQIWTGSTNSPTVGLLEQELDVAGFVAENNLDAPPWTLRIEHGGTPMGVQALEGETSTYKLEVELGDIRPREANLELRQNGCVIEVSTDGQNWTTIYDPTDCVDGLIDQGIQDAIDDGRIAVPDGQPGPSAPPDQGTCKTYHVKLNGRDVWHLPSPVSNDDTITITNAKGGWTDGTGAWYCPDGSAYLLGQCVGALKIHHPDDPINPDAWHMELIGRYGEQYFNALDNGSVTVSGLESPVDVFFMANDASLTDNSGDIEFDVEICTSGWTQVWDFTTGQHGWTLDGTHGGVYVEGVGFRTTYADGRYQCLIRLANLPEADYIRALVLVETDGEKHMYARFGNYDSENFLIEPPSTEIETVHVIGGVNENAYVQPYSDAANTAIVKRVKISGNGANPFV